jgi:hypothetical protein
MIQKLDNKSREALEAAAFRRLISHLQNHTDVQNIDLMNLASFCRNCLSGWYQEEAEKRGIVLGERRGARNYLRDALRAMERNSPARGNAPTT